MRAILLVLTFLLVYMNTYAQEAPINGLSLDSYFDVETVSNPKISPNGKEIVYTRGWIDRMHDEREASIWIIKTDGTKNRFLVDGRNPSWSPDGSRIAFTAKGDPEGTQLFVMYRDEAGNPTQITRLEYSPSNITWSPDGKMAGIHDVHSTEG